MQNTPKKQFLKIQLAYFFPHRCYSFANAEAEGVNIVVLHFIAAAGIARIAPRWRGTRLWGTAKAMTVVDANFLHTWGIFLYVPQDLPSCCQVWPCVAVNVSGANLTAAGEKAGDPDGKRSF